MDYLLLALGLIAAGLGGEVFIRGAVGLANMARIPPGIIGATVAAFATSSPELAVAITSALANKPEIALGNAVGANVTNIGALLGTALLLSPTYVRAATLKRDFPVALIAPMIIALLAIGGVISRLDGALLILFFGVWLTATIMEARRQRDLTEQILGTKPFIAVVYSILGLGLLVIAGNLVVISASTIARAFGVDEYVIGATIVALGTTVPEFATTVIASLRGHEELAIGVVLGSNIFNGLFIVGVASLITPISISWPELAIGLAVGAALVAITYPNRTRILDRRRGALLVAIYIVYIIVMLQYRTGTTL